MKEHLQTYLKENGYFLEPENQLEGLTADRAFVFIMEPTGTSYIIKGVWVKRASGEWWLE